MSQRHIELRMPDLDVGHTIVTASTWHAAVGSRVIEGDRLLEVLAGEVTVDLAAPASGRLTQRCVEVDERIAIGQRLAVIELS